MSKARHNWNQTLITLGTILPVMLIIGGLILSRSNSSAVTTAEVQDLSQEVKALQTEQFKMELAQARQSCKR